MAPLDATDRYTVKTSPFLALFEGCAPMAASHDAPSRAAHSPFFAHATVMAPLDATVRYTVKTSPFLALSEGCAPMCQAKSLPWSSMTTSCSIIWVALSLVG